MFTVDSMLASDVILFFDVAKCLTHTAMFLTVYKYYYYYYYDLEKVRSGHGKSGKYKMGVLCTHKQWWKEYSDRECSDTTMGKFSITSAALKILLR